MINSVPVQGRPMASDVGTNDQIHSELEHAVQSSRRDSERLPTEHLQSASINPAQPKHSPSDFSVSEYRNAQKKDTELKKGDGADMADFQKRSEDRTLKQMELQEHIADLNNRKAIHDSLLKQEKDNTEATTKYAQAAAARGKDAADQYNR